MGQQIKALIIEIILSILAIGAIAWQAFISGKNSIKKQNQDIQNEKLRDTKTIDNYVDSLPDVDLARILRKSKKK